LTAAQARRVATAKITRDPHTSIARASARSCSSPQSAVLIAGFRMTPALTRSVVVDQSNGHKRLADRWTRLGLPLADGAAARPA
jgi:hypothetical protein